jgi:membrane protease YdiL (CAAX protease family)
VFPADAGVRLSERVTRTEESQPAPMATGRDLRAEVLLVLGVSVGASAVFAVVNLIGRLTARIPLAQSQATLNGSYAPGRPLLDLTLQLLSIGFGVVPALLAVHLLRRTGVPATAIGLDRGRPRQDLFRGVLLAAVIGIPGLLLYLAAHALGVSAIVVAEALPDVWWRIPVLILSAAMNAVLEEVVVVGYLLTRLSRLGWRPGPALLASAVLRGSYHLYQGFGAFLGNAVMGLLFGRVFQRTGRVLPLVIAHTILDSVAFVGYALLHGRVSWLP